jgi:hypothetical protein
MSSKKKNNGGKLPNWTQLSLGGSMGAAQRALRRCSETLGVISTGATQQAFGRVLNSQVANSQEWNSLSARYVEFRVLEIKVTIVPLASSAGATSGQSMLIMAGDRSGSLAVPSAQATVWGLQAPKVYTFNTTMPCKYTMRAIDLEEQNFVSVGAPVASYGIQYSIYAPAYTSSTVAYLLIEWVVEFKGAQ